MSENSRIEWTGDTWNFITGCSLESPGCTNCYAMKLAGSRLQHHPSRVGLTKMTSGGPVWTGEVRFNPQWLLQPLRRTKPRKIFPCAHADLFHPDVPESWIDQGFAVMLLAQRHTFQVLTKRPARMMAYITPEARLRWIAIALQIDPTCGERVRSVPFPLPNVHCGISAEDQKRWDERYPFLLRTAAVVRWASLEPLLHRIDLCAAFGMYWNTSTEAFERVGSAGPQIDWIVGGGESGPGARPMHPNWIRMIRDHCNAAGVAFFFKQWGEFGPGSTNLRTGHRVFREFENFQQWVNKGDTWVNGGICLDQNGTRLKIGADMMRAREAGAFPVVVMHPMGKGATGRELDGREWNEFPRERLTAADFMKSC